MSQQRYRSALVRRREGRLRPRALGLVLAATLIGGWLGWKAYLNFRQGYQTAAEVLELERDLAGAQAERERLQTYRDLVGTPAGKQLEARRQFLRVRPGERLLVPGEGEDLDAPAQEATGAHKGAPPPRSVLKRWAVPPPSPPAEEDTG